MGLRRAVSVLAAGAAVLFAGPTAHCYTEEQIGVNSNFAVMDGKVHFAQSDGSLTVLSLATGEVLARKKGVLCAGTLKLTDKGLLVVLYESAVLLDRATLEPLWERTGQHVQEVLDDRFIADDGWGLLTCRSLASGSVLWSYNLPGAPDIVAEKGKVLLFNSASLASSHFPNEVVVLDLESGQEVLRKKAPAGVQYTEAYFDGGRIYLASQPERRMIVLDLAGAEVESIPVPLERADSRWQVSKDVPFVLGGKAFAYGRVWASLEDVPPWGPGMGGGPLDTETDAYQETFKLEGASLLFRVTQWGAAIIEFHGPDASWRGYIPYLSLYFYDPKLRRQVEEALSMSPQAKEPRDVWAYYNWGTSPGIAYAALHNGRLLIGTNMGHVECFDAASGESLWMYTFPTESQAMSMSFPHGLGPYYVDRARQHARLNELARQAKGTILLPRELEVDFVRPMGLEAQGAAPSTRITFDPEPSEDPYKKLPYYVAAAWAGLALPLAGLALILSRTRLRAANAGRAAAWGLGLLALAACAFLRFGRVASSSTQLMRVATILLALYVLGYAIALYRQKRVLAGTLALLGWVIVVFLALPAILYA